jgi:hypothetical protein
MAISMCEEAPFSRTIWEMREGADLRKSETEVRFNDRPGTQPAKTKTK